jgi:general secretion pathway protein D
MPLSFAVAALLVGCSTTDNGLRKDDYSDLVNRVPPKAAVQTDKAPPIPDLQPILAAPPPPTIAQRLVTVSVTDPSVPLRDVLLELSRKVGVDIELDPNISGGVIISAKDRPFIDVIDRICDLTNLRYSFKNNVLHVEVDGMYHQTYHLDLLNSTRSTTTDITTSTSINTLISGGGGGGGNSTSTSDVNSKSTIDAWAEVETNIKQILANSNPRVQPVATNNTGSMISAAVVPLGARRGTAASPLEGEEAPGTAPASGGTAPAPGAPTAAAVAQAAAAGLAAVSAPQNYAEDSPRGGAGGRASAPSAPAGGATAAAYSINKQAVIVSVFGTGRQHKLVKAYFDKLLAKAGAQVLIEAKVVEVTLNDQYNTGVDWTALRQNLRGTGFGISGNNPSTNTTAAAPALPAPGDLSTPFGGTGFNAGFTTFGGDLAMMINLIKVYGTTRTLSSPRITVMNNQTAVIKVAENHVYFKLTATVTSTPAVAGTAASQTATYSSTLQTLPIGLVMTVQPSIDAEHDQVTLGLRPTVTAWPGTSVSDPAVALGLASACGNSTASACSTANISSAITSSSVPVVDVREMDSVVTMPSGAVVVMGGLMQEVVSKTDSGIPGAEDAPLVGNLFKANSQQTQLTELVIFLKATVVHGTDSVDWADRDLYKRFMHDPRPLGF